MPTTCQALFKIGKTILFKSNDVSYDSVCVFTNRVQPSFQLLTDNKIMNSCQLTRIFTNGQQTQKCLIQMADVASGCQKLQQSQPCSLFPQPVSEPPCVQFIFFFLNQLLLFQCSHLCVGYFTRSSHKVLLLVLELDHIYNK